MRPPCPAVTTTRVPGGAATAIRHGNAIEKATIKHITFILIIDSLYAARSASILLRRNALPTPLRSLRWFLCCMAIARKVMHKYYATFSIMSNAVLRHVSSQFLLFPFVGMYHFVSMGKGLLYGPHPSYASEYSSLVP